MTRFSRTSGKTISVLAIGILFLSTLSAEAAQPRKRAVTPAVTVGTPVAMIGVVKDSANGLPVQGARAFYSDQSVPTNGNGEFVINVPAGTLVSISVQHPGFLPFSRTVKVDTAGVKIPFDLTEQASVTVKTTADKTFILDIGTLQFGYSVPLSNNITSDDENFCKPDGTSFTPNKSEFRKIIGPATPTTLASCCEGPLMMANAEFKSGESTAVYFKDSCRSGEVILLGREKSTGVTRFFKFTDVAEIDFQ